MQKRLLFKIFSPIFSLIGKLKHLHEINYSYFVITPKLMVIET